MDRLKGWPPQPSTVVGLGVAVGALFYAVTGDPAWAALVTALVQVMVPDNTK